MAKTKLSTKNRNQHGDFYTTIRLDKVVSAKLKKYIDRTGATKAGVINLALDTYLTAFAKKMGWDDIKAGDVGETVQ